MSNASGMVAGWFDNCPDLLTARASEMGEQTMYWLFGREYLRAAGGPVATWDRSWERTPDGWMKYIGADGRPPKPVGTAKDYFDYVAQITEDRLPNDLAVANCRVDWQGLAQLGCAVAKPIIAGDTTNASLIGNQFKSQGTVPSDAAIAADPAYQGLAFGLDSGFPPPASGCPEGTSLSGGVCLPTKTEKKGWPTWLWAMLGIGGAAVVGAVAVAVARANPASSAPRTAPPPPHAGDEWAVVDFVDGNASWRESGWLHRTRTGFVLHVVNRGKIDGTRVFPLGHRRAEVYVGNATQPMIIEHDWRPAGIQIGG